ncbi:glycosyltransferase [Halobacteriales archaeon Cl-PHB]
MHVLNLTNAKTSFYRHQVSALEAQGVDCTTLEVPGRKGRGDTRSPVDYLRFWPRSVRAVDDRYDVVHANFGLLAPMALSQRQLPVVTTLWGTDLYGPMRWLTKATAPLSDATIVMSAAMAGDVRGDCDVIPHGVDLDRFEPQPTERARERVGWDDGRYHVLFPYPPDREVKNYPLAAQVVSMADDRTDRAVVLESVSGVPHEEFPTYVNAADCLLLTSRHEGSPNVVKEAMACNLPVVSRDVGDVAERLDGVWPSAVCEDDVDLPDGLVGVLEAEERSNGREAVRPLSLERMGERLREVYERVIAEDGAKRHT